METGLQLPQNLPFQAVPVHPPAPVLPHPAVEIVERRETAPIERRKRGRPGRAVLLGLCMMLMQVAAAVLIIAPDGPLDYRYTTLIQHDSYWFANIVDRGYETIVPPIDRKMMEVSNVAFFPAYPAITWLVRSATGLGTYQALLVTAQIAAWGFWSYFFLFCDRWRISPVSQFFGALAIAAHPTAFFLVAGYSESMFLMALLGFAYWSVAEGSWAKPLAGVHGILMSATRIVGIPCAAFPVVRAICKGGFRALRDVRAWSRNYGPAIAVTSVAMLGAAGFFAYCQVRWGRWDMYLLTQYAGWAIEADYLAVFKPSSYHWVLPPLTDPTQWSQMTMTLGAVVLAAVAVCETVAALRQRTNWQSRVSFYFAAAVTYYIAVSGVASVQMESMLRYQFCGHAVIVLALLHFLGQFPSPPRLVRAIGMAAVGVVALAGFGLQAWWIWNFTRGNWVA